MNMITKEALEFLDEAREQFNKNPDYTTYRDEKANFIALRTGFREDCITIYELGNPVGNFADQLPRQHKVVVDYDKLDKINKLREKLIQELDRAELLMSKGSDTDYNLGLITTIRLVLNELPLKENL